MWERHEGDDLLSDDSRLKFIWDWDRSAKGMTKEEKARWTHFQISESTIGDWVMSVIQWGEDTIYYRPTIEYQNDDRSIFIDHESEEEYSVIETRIEAQIKAEKMLIEWITDAEKQTVSWIRKEHKLIMDVVEKYDKECYNCEVEWLDDELSTEQVRCDECLAGDNNPNFEVNKWLLENGRLHFSPPTGSVPENDNRS